MADYVGQFMRYLEGERNLSYHTCKGYRADLDQFFGYLASHRRIRKGAVGGQEPFPVQTIDRRMIRAFMAYLRNKDYSRASIARKLATLRTFFRFLCREGVIENNPATMVATPRLNRELPSFLSEEETEKLIEAPDCTTALGLRDRAILETLYSSGMRASELVALDLDSLDLINGSARIRGKWGKERNALLGEPAVRTLRAYLRVRGRLARGDRGADKVAVFISCNGNRLSARDVQRIVSKYARRIAPGRRVGPHSLRHSFATHLLDRGASLRDVQEMLGHRTLSTTQVYIHLTTQRLKAVYQAAHPHA